MNDYKYYDFVKYAVPKIRTKYKGTLVYTHHIKIISNTNIDKSIDYYPKGEKAVLMYKRRTIKSIAATPDELFKLLGV